MESYT